jgi:hypothetical protein
VETLQPSIKPCAHGGVIVPRMKKKRGRPGGRKKKESIGAEMARKRWSKTTAAQRLEVGAKLAAARKAKRERLKKPDEPPES